MIKTYLLRLLPCFAIAVGCLLYFYAASVVKQAPPSPKVLEEPWVSKATSHCPGAAREYLESEEESRPTPAALRKEPFRPAWVIPLLATNIEYDFVNETTGQGFLSRLVDGWAGQPVANKLIVTAGCNAAVQ